MVWTVVPPLHSEKYQHTGRRHSSVRGLVRVCGREGGAAAGADRLAVIRILNKDGGLHVQFADWGGCDRIRSSNNQCRFNRRLGREREGLDGVCDR